MITGRGATRPITLRTFVPGDEAQLVELWNRAYARYGGHVVRTVEYWRWCILERPGVEPENIVIVSGSGAPLAYGVLGPGGAVLEMAIDPALVGRQRRAATEQVVRALEDRGRARGDETIEFLLPSCAGPVVDHLRNAGYRTEDASSLILQIVDLATLVRTLLMARQSRFPRGWSPTFQIQVAPGGYRFCPQRVLHVQIGPPLEVTVEQEQAGPMSAAESVRNISTDLSSIADIILGRTTLDEALRSGRVKVDAAAHLPDVRMLISALTFETPWFTPSADGR
jgi:hypothetical protein